MRAPALMRPEFAYLELMLYSKEMNKVIMIAFITCVILFIIAVFLSPMVDIQPSALRAQLWLSLIVAMFTLAIQIVICLLPVPASIVPQNGGQKYQRLVDLAGLTCCLLC